MFNSSYGNVMFGFIVFRTFELITSFSQLSSWLQRHNQKKSSMNKTIIVKIEKGKISIPEDMEIDDDKVYLKKIGNTLYVIPFHDPWQSLIESVDDFSDDFLDKRVQPDTDIREKF